MNRIILGFLLILTMISMICCISCVTLPKANLVATVIDRSVKLDYLDHSCSSYILDSHRLVTAAHCVSEDLPMAKNIEILSISKVDESIDLAVYEIALINIAETQIASPVLGEDIVCISFPGVYDTDRIVMRGYVNDVQILSDNLEVALTTVVGMQGSSGAAVLNSSGQIIGIVSRIGKRTEPGTGIVFTFNILVSGSTLRQFLQGT